MYVEVTLILQQQTADLVYLFDDAPKICDFNVMNQKMRQAVLNAHNTRKSLLAKGKVERNFFSHENMPTATIMLYVVVTHMYDCVLEKKAAYSRPCQKRPPPTTFIYTGMNFHYINTEVENFRPVKTPKEAIGEAAREWWDLHMNYTKFEGVTPRVNDFPIIPFLIAIMVGIPMYKEGPACEGCPYGYKCDERTKLCKDKNL
ncbi:hypothetical protein TELCIR_06147 [Teladorsagia circumcincta]|uniref:SCP domain-containing protein n=1 Tax=Teladorsagia circumcincta TaxID=45464 RepID=A0A2G9UP51_TELCI|nr:hypothetical protein TELCIR_06147 [Teladorsagia circumcincta]